MVEVEVGRNVDGRRRGYYEELGSGTDEIVEEEEYLEVEGMVDGIYKVERVVDIRKKKVCCLHFVNEC